MMRTLFFASSLSLLLVLCVAHPQPHQAHHHAHQHAAEVEELIVTLKQSDDMRFDAHLSAFVDYTRSFDKRYTSVSEFLLRLENYKASMKRVALLQAEAGDVTQFGPTIFSDMSDKEFESTMLMDSPFLGLSEPGAIPSENQHDVTPPTTAHMLGDDKVVDWRPTGIVTPVKNQGRCGSCWAFSTVEELESMWALKNNNTLSIGSTQQLVSCAPTEGGCGGGWPYRSYGYINTAGGLLTEQEYPYTSGTNGVTGTCTDPKTKRTIGIYNGTPNFGYATTSGACFFGTCDTQNMQQVVDVLKNRGPASVCVNATPWRDYVGGVLKAAQCPHASNTINHCVQAVGYNLNDATPYFIIRNSWGAGWGLAGYLNIEIAGNACGVGNVATVPFIRGSWN